MREYATSTDIQQLIDAWSEKARQLMPSPASNAYFECADALLDLGPLPYAGTDHDERHAHVVGEVARGAMTPNQARELLWSS
jgi:hypothetical protein